METEMPRGKGEALGLSEVPMSWMQSTQDIQRLMMGGVNLDGSLKPETILALLRFHGVGAIEIAREFGITHQQVRDVITRKRKTRYIQDRIAECLQMESDRVWGRR